MPALYITAAVTFVLSALIWGSLLYALSREKRYIWLFIPGLASSYLVNILFKSPLANFVVSATGIDKATPFAQQPLWYWGFALLLAPVFEEMIKVVPLILPPIRAWLTSPLNALWIGLGLGISYGLGEILYLAYLFVSAPSYAELANQPWYYFMGFLQERFIVCLVHGLMTAIVVSGLQRGGRYSVLGYLGGIMAHALVNSTALVIRVIPGIDWVASLGLLVSLFILLGIFDVLRRRAQAQTPNVATAEIVYFERTPH